MFADIRHWSEVRQIVSLSSLHSPARRQQTRSAQKSAHKYGAYMNNLKSVADDSYVLLNGRQQCIDMCGVEGKRRLCDLIVTSSSPALATRHIRIVGQ